MNRTRSALFAGLSSYYAIFLGLLRVVVLSRIFSAEEFGIFSICMTIAVFGRTFRFFGVYTYIVSVETLNREVERTCFTIVLISSLVIFTAFSSLSPFLGQTYGSEDLTNLALVMSFGFLLGPLGAISNAVMSREMKFGQIAVVQILSNTADIAVSLWLAVEGYGVISLGIGFVASILVSAIAFGLYDASRLFYRPSAKGWKGIAKFGVSAVATNTSDRVSDMAPNLIAGVTLGLADVGYYNRGTSLIGFFRKSLESIAGNISMSWLADKSRSENHLLLSSFERIIIVMTGFLFPAYCFIALAADLIIFAVMGAGWEQSVPVAQIMALAGLLATQSFLGARLLMSCRIVKDNAIISFIRLVVLVVCLLATSHLGITWVAWSFLISSLVYAVFIQYRLKKHFDFGLLRLLKALLPALLLSVLTGSVVYVVRPWISSANIFIDLMMLSGIFGLTWLACVFLSSHPLKTEIARLYKSIRSG